MQRNFRLRSRHRTRYASLAAVTIGTCSALGFGCLQAVLATIGVTFF